MDLQPGRERNVGEVGVTTQSERLCWYRAQLAIIYRLMEVEARDPADDGGRLLSILDQLEARVKDQMVASR